MTSRPTLVGRNAEIEALGVQLAGPNPLAVITGSAGIGKSSVLAELARRRTDAGSVVWPLVATEYDRRPLAPFAALIADHRPETRVGDRPNVFGSWSRTDTDLAAVDLVLDLIAESDRPVTLLLDDAQWADAATLATLRVASRRVGELDLAIVLARRPLPMGTHIERAVVELRAGGALDLVLHALSTDAVSEMVTAMIGDTPRPELLAALQQAAGNPFFVRQLVEVMRSGDGAIETAASANIANLRDSVLYWLGSLDAEAISVLQIAAVLGPNLDLHHLAELRGTSVGSLLTPIRQCVRAGVLGEHDGELRFTHDLVREAIYDDMPERVRSTVHLAIARRARGLQHPPSEYVRHLVAGSQDATPASIQLLREVGREHLEWAPIEARQLFERAAELDPAPLIAEDALDLARALSWTGSVRECVELVDRIRDQSVTDPVVDARLEAVGAMARLIAGAPASLAADAFERIGAVDGLDSQEVAYLLTDAALARLMSASFGEAKTLAEQAIDRFGDGIGAAMDHGVLAWVASFAGDVEGSLLHVEHLLRLANRAAPGDLIHTVADFFAAMTYIDANRLDDAVRTFHEGRAKVTASGAIWALPLYHQGLGAALFMRGRWSEAAAELETGLGISRDIDAVHADLYAHATLSLLELGRGDLDAAEAHLEAGEALLLEGAPPIGLNWLQLARGLALEGRGDPRSGSIVIFDAWNLDLALGIHNDLATIAPRLVATAQRADAHEIVERVIDDLERLVRDEGLRQLEPCLRWCTAMRDADADSMARAVDQLRTSPRLIDLASALIDHAVLIAGTNRAQASALMSEAYRILDAADARMVVLHADHRARSVGLDPPSMVHDDPWSRLSPVEAKVVDLVTAGNTNRAIGDELFISHRTVETHLKNIFRKVGVRNRVELTSAAFARA